jgi:hypothetical protein
VKKKKKSGAQAIVYEKYTLDSRMFHSTSHYNAYMNPNLTTWEQAGYTFPAYSLNSSC